jgi:hypothetical protein
MWARRPGGTIAHKERAGTGRPANAQIISTSWRTTAWAPSAIWPMVESSM